MTGPQRLPLATRAGRRLRALLRGVRARAASGGAAADAAAVPPLAPDVDPATLAPDTPVAFTCNLCGTPATQPFRALHRETPSCAACGSNVRFRAIGRLVAVELFGRECTLPELPPAPQVKALGLSDSTAYADVLARKLAYTNTYFHTEPRLDITVPDPARAGSLDLLISSEVFEHVPPPASRAFVNARAMLKDGGVMIFTVPFSLEPDTREHFPDLHEWSLDQRDGRYVLANRTRDGRRQTFDDLVFHGGPGSTLEMRLFSKAAVLRELEAAGFRRVRIADEPCLRYGIHWPEPWSVPIVARA